MSIKDLLSAQINCVLLSNNLQVLPLLCIVVSLSPMFSLSQSLQVLLLFLFLSINLTGRYQGDYQEKVNDNSPFKDSSNTNGSFELSPLSKPHTLSIIAIIYSRFCECVSATVTVVFASDFVFTLTTHQNCRYRRFNLTAILRKTLTTAYYALSCN